MSEPTPSTPAPAEARPPVSDALIQSLNGRVGELERGKAQLNSALKQARAEAKDAKAAADAAKTQNTALTTERDTWKQKAEAAPGDHAKRVSDLEGQLSQRDHKDTYRASAIAAGVDPHKVDDLYSLSGLKPGDKPATAEDFAEHLTAAKTERAWAFGGSSSNPDAAGQAANSQGPLKVAPTPPPTGAGRSASDNSSGRFTYRASDLGNPAWMASNQGKLAEAVKDGSAVEVK